jgi:putative transposase
MKSGRPKMKFGCRWFGLTASIVPAVVRYIQNQEAHHRKMSFDEEFLALLRKHGVGFDPQFVFG